MKVIMQRVAQAGLLIAGASAVVVPSASGATNPNKVVAPGVPTLAQLYKGSFSEPPTVSAKPAKGKSVWWISCDQAVQTCAQPAAAAAQGAKILGINFHVADGKFDVGGAYNTAIETALAAKPSGIILYGEACTLIKGQLEQAKADHIPVIGVNTPDCSDTGGPRLLTVHMNYGRFKSAPGFWRAYGAASADYVIDATDGHAKIIDNAGTEALQLFTDQGFRAELKKCKGCSIVDTVSYDTPALTPNGAWIQAFRAALAQNPTATATYMPWDAMWTLGGAQAIRQSGHKLISFGGQGVPSGLQLVKEGLITAESSAESDIWSGYAGIDAMNRALVGAPQVSEGQGFQLVTPGHNMPVGSDNYSPSIDFAKIYLHAWKVAAKKYG